MLIGSDTIPLPGNPHPRTAGTFSRVLGRYVRDGGITDIPSMIRRMTAFPADRFRLGSQGLLMPGYVADIAVLDQERVFDNADYSNPLQPPSGIRHVLVGGQSVVTDGRYSGARPGRVLEPT